MNLDKTLSAKRAWAEAVSMAQRGRVLYIASISLLYKSGKMNREAVLRTFLEEGITRDDLRRFREWRSGTKVTDFSPI